MDSSLQIRKLLPSHVRELASMLETHELWKRLMSIIPTQLDKYNYKCDLTANNPHKYSSEHFRMIENESEISARTCTEILFTEWGTSGKIRPALGHLLHLLTKANLFRAADYVAVDLLHLESPKRPDNGPEAPIPVNLSEMIREHSEDDIEKILDNVDYVSKAVNLIRTYSDKTPKRSDKIPEIIITPDAEEVSRPTFHVPVVIQREPDHPEEVSDMMKFSSTSTQNSVVEEFPVVINENAHESREMNMPNLDKIMISSTDTNNSNMNTETNVISSCISSSESTTECNTSDISDQSASEVSNSTDSYNPAFSQILGPTVQPEVDGENIPNISILNLEVKDGPLEPNLSILNLEMEDATLEPNLSILNLEASDVSAAANLQNNGIDSNRSILPDFDVLQAESEEVTHESTQLPDFNMLQVNSVGSQNTQISNSSNMSTENTTKSRCCTSPLPNLSLDTVLPHYSYQDLEIATNNFNKKEFKGHNLEGRLLGSGEFGSVFLALDLLNKPVAVKKLFLDDVEMVNVDDEVTIQFRNEVEVLSKYKHENLLSLLGYSCDGSTYCLLYDYIPGGPLSDKLQNNPAQLSWKQRLNIAMGTSKAISYLHTGFSNPLIHRDIKSANILLDSRNQPKLCDFGLIKLIPNQKISTATTIFGTSAYMPREAFARDISVKLDTFSFGVVMLELLTSLPPLDFDREGVDLVTHIGETVDDDNISTIVDYRAGTWEENSVDYAKNLYKVAQTCLEEKRKRPTMVEVKMVLDDLIKNTDVC